MAGALWTSDLHFEGGRVKVRTTGADLSIDRGLIVDVALWTVYYIPVRLKGLATALVRPGPRVWFAPDIPRPWYLLWLAACWGGVRIARSPGQADAAIFFEDQTVSRPPSCELARQFNFGCDDVSKSHVARVFESIFGYALTVDPETWTGPAVEKGEDNGAHDGRIVQCPTAALPGRVYQRVVDTVEGDHVVDLRTPCVGGRPVVTFIKRRPARDRFANYNSTVALHRPHDLFSPEELATIGRFCAAMKLDWGGLDILRDRADGRLYIVDVNKTDMPPLRLPWRQKLEAISRLSKALLTMIDGKTAEAGA